MRHLSRLGLLAIGALLAGSAFAQGPATCAISGTLLDGGGNPIANTEVRMRAVTPTTSGAFGITSNDLKTKTAIDGTWTLTMVQGLAAQVDIPAVPLAKDLTVPTGAQCPAAFTSITLHNRGSLTPATILSTTGPSAGGDLAGSFPSPVVSGLRTQPLYAELCTNGQARVYDSASGSYRCATVAGGSVTSVTAGTGIAVTGSATAPVVGVSAIPEASVTNLTTDLAGKLDKSGGTMTGALTLVGAPVADLQPATRLYVDTGLAGKLGTGGTIAESQVTGLVSDLAAKEVAANKGQPSGYASLDGSSKVPLGQLPATMTPTAHASTHATGSSDPVSPAAIGASAVGHGHVESDTTGLIADLAAKANLSGATFSGLIRANGGLQVVGTYSTTGPLTAGTGQSLGVFMASPTGVASAPHSGGSLPDGVYYWVVTALDGAGGETLVSNETSLGVGGVNKSATITWSPVLGAQSYRVWRGASPSLESVYFTATSPFVDTGAAGTGGTLPVATTAYVIKFDGVSDSRILTGKLGLGKIPATALDVAGTVTATGFAGPLTGNADTSSDGLSSASGTAPLTLSLAAKALTGSVAQFGNAAAGIVPASGGGSSNFLRADQTWGVPPGLVQSVALALPAEMTVTGSPGAGAVALGATWASEAQNRSFASPDGVAGTPSFRALVSADLPNPVVRNLTGNVTGNVTGTAASFTGNLAGDVTGPQGTTVVATVGTSTAANVHAAELLANAATAANTAGAILRRDGAGQVAATTFTGALVGNASGTAAGFTGSLIGDVTGTQGATVVSLVNGSTAANVHAAELAANAATATNTPSTILKRDGAGQVAATTFTGALVGNATTAGDGLTSASGTAPLTLTLSSKALTGSVAVFGGATGGANGTTGLVPQPQAGDQGKALFGDGTWRTTAGAGTVNSVAVDSTMTATANPITSSGTLGVAVPLPALAGNTLRIPRVNAGETAIEYRTPAQHANDIGAISLSYNLVGDVTGTLGTTSVGLVNGVAASTVAAGATLANAATSANTLSAIVKRDGSGNFSAGTITANLTGNASGTAGSFTGSLLGDVTGTQGATVVSTVGTSSAANVHAAELLANAATSANTASAIVRRDGAGNFTAGTITAALTGNVTGNASGSAATFTSNLTGDVTSTAMTTTVATVGGSTAANVHAAEVLANAATDANTASAIVKRDASGNYSAGTATLAKVVPTSAVFASLVDNGNAGATHTIDWTAGNKQKITTNANCTLTFTAPSGPTSLTLLIVHEASTTAYTYTWPVSVKWQNAVPAVTTNTSGSVDIVSCIWATPSYYCVGNANFQ